MSQHPPPVSRRAPEKSNSFNYRCSLLSQYLKQKGTFGDLGLKMTRDLQKNGTCENFRPTTTNLLQKLEDSREEGGADLTVKPRASFPQRDDLFSAVDAEGPSKHVDFSPTTKPSAEKPLKAQMTIFYAGRVMVFDDFPAEKAKELMLLADKSLASASGSCDLPPNPNLAASASATTKNPQADGSDLPIARRVSLHRFLEKRKGRISSKAPYQVNEEGSSCQTSSKKPEGSKSWLGLSHESD